MRQSNTSVCSRRTFLAGGPAVPILLASKQGVGQTPSQEESRARLRLSCQEWLLPPDDFYAKIEFARYYGIAGIELDGRGLPDRVEAVQNALKDSGIQVSAIALGYSGVPISHEPSERGKAIESCQEILQAAGELQSTGLIVVPALNGQTELDHVEGRKALIDFLLTIADTAQLAGTRVLLEPLNRQEAWFLRQLHDAGAICRDVNHPAIAMMGGFYHMGIEEVCDYSALYGVRDYCHHIHLASRPSRKQPGFDPHDDFRPGFRALKAMNYQAFCSFEGTFEGRDKEALFKESIAYVKQQWQEA